MGNCSMTFPSDIVGDLENDVNAGKYRSSVCNILLLGAGDAGKSSSFQFPNSKRSIHTPKKLTKTTIFTAIRKQLSNVYALEFRSAEYRKTFAPIIVGNILDGTLQVLSKMENMRGVFVKIQQEARLGAASLSPSIMKTISSLYFDNPVFLETIKTRASDVQLADSYHEFVKRLKDYPAWGGYEWIPSVDDCIRARERTFGISNLEIKINLRRICIYDVGGQRAERRKWLNNYANLPKMSLAIFAISSSEYDQYLFEDRPKNRLEESLDLFEETINSDWLRKVPVVLLLNKKDLFDRKLVREDIPLNVSGRFRDAPLTKDPSEAITWIVSRFAQRRTVNRKLCAFVLSATSASRVKSVFDQIEGMLTAGSFFVDPASSQKSTNISTVSSQSLG